MDQVLVVVDGVRLGKHHLLQRVVLHQVDIHYSVVDWVEMELQCLSELQLQHFMAEEAVEESTLL